MEELKLNEKYLKYILDVRTRSIQWRNIDKDIFMLQRAKEDIEERLRNVKEDLHRLNEELDEVFAEENKCIGMLLKYYDPSLNGTTYFVCQRYDPTIGEGGGFWGYRIYFGDGKIQTETNIKIETVFLKEYYTAITYEAEKREICGKVADSYKENLSNIILNGEFLTKGKENKE